MRLESARNLKQELLGDVMTVFTQAPGAVHSATARAVARAMGVDGPSADASVLAVGAKRMSTLPQIQRTVALGVAPRGREYRIAIRLQRAALRDSALVEHVTKKANGEVDVRLVGRIDKRAAAPWYRRNQRPLLIGSSVGHIRVTAGTIGAFVTRGGAICILSNNHVLADENRAAKGDLVLQRGSLDGGKRADAVGKVAHWVPLKVRGSNRVDAALAAVNKTIVGDHNRLRALVNGKDRTLAGLGPPFLDEDAVVYKVGRTTGATRGRVTAFDLDNVVVNFDAGNLRFDGQIEIEGTGRAPFSDGGDSGSLIVDKDMNAVALLFAGSETGGANDAGLTYANPIHEVLKRVGAKLLP